MKAIVQDRYGPPDVLELREIPKPAPGPGQLLVRVRAASINARDWHFLRGDPLLARAMAPQLGWKAPRTTIRGSDFAGVVKETGAGVTRFRPGDEVFGDLCPADGAFAEYACVPEADAEHKPAGISLEEAAALPMAGATALRGLRDTAQVQPGQHVLINGASGGVGTFAIQIAKSFGCTVTAVCRTGNADLVRSAGADHVVDYTRADFTATGPYDVVFDLVGNRSLAELRRPLTPAGVAVLSGGGNSGNGRNSVLGPMGLFIRAKVSSRRVRILEGVSPARELGALRQLVEAGKLRPVIDRRYTLSQVPDAIRYMEAEHARAKVVITVA
ncbi:NAD(P)-dependent alcohol dehydrogenase [Longispora albida]|uniref:NAD(P)-dependent alcohol dehydrogenase n=1 Tax=Longispora albida TaxID=203523 RepID=UPI00036B8078|nr:NAD(P)-dependent alcohol dehydrogenase [Longispora albida]